MYQALSRLTVLQATESWAGPGNEARYYGRGELVIITKGLLNSSCAKCFRNYISQSVQTYLLLVGEAAQNCRKK